MILAFLYALSYSPEEIPGSGGPVAVSRDGSVIASVDYNETRDYPIVINTTLGEILYNQNFSTYSISALSISDDGNKLAVALLDPSSPPSITLYEYSSSAWYQINSIIANAVPNICISLSGDGSTLFVGSRKFSTRIYVDNTTDYLEYQINTNDLSSSKDGNVLGLVTSSAEADAKVLFNGTQHDLTTEATSISISEDGTTVAVGKPGLDTVEIYTYNGSGYSKEADLSSTTGLTENFGVDVSISADGRTLAILATNETYLAKKTDAWNMIIEEKGDYRAIALSGDASTFTAMKASTLQIWRSSTSTTTTTLTTLTTLTTATTLTTTTTSTTLTTLTTATTATTLTTSTTTTTSTTLSTSTTSTTSTEAFQSCCQNLDVTFTGALASRSGRFLYLPLCENIVVYIYYNEEQNVAIISGNELVIASVNVTLNETQGCFNFDYSFYLESTLELEDSNLQSLQFYTDDNCLTTTDNPLYKGSEVFDSALMIEASKTTECANQVRLTFPGQLDEFSGNYDFFDCGLNDVIYVKTDNSHFLELSEAYLSIPKTDPSLFQGCLSGIDPIENNFENTTIESYVKEIVFAPENLNYRETGCIENWIFQSFIKVYSSDRNDVPSLDMTITIGCASLPDTSASPLTDEATSDLALILGLSIPLGLLVLYAGFRLSKTTPLMSESALKTFL